MACDQSRDAPSGHGTNRVTGLAREARLIAPRSPPRIDADAARSPYSRGWLVRSPGPAQPHGTPAAHRHRAHDPAVAARRLAAQIA